MLTLKSLFDIGIKWFEGIWQEYKTKCGRDCIWLLNILLRVLWKYDQDQRRHGSLPSWSWGNQNWFTEDVFGRNSPIWRCIQIVWCLTISYYSIYRYWWISSKYIFRESILISSTSAWKWAMSSLVLVIFPQNPQQNVQKSYAVSSTFCFILLSYSFKPFNSYIK